MISDQFANIELVLMRYLSPIAPADTVAPETGTGIRVLRVGGSDDTITDYPRVEISCFADRYHDAVALGETCRQRMLALGGESVEISGADGTRLKVTVDFCRTDTPPERVPYDNPDRRHDIAYYQLGLMRPRVLPA